VQVYLVS